jgi:polysaccharide deacetylase family protein (PEP-CTERM system associated)
MSSHRTILNALTVDVEDYFHASAFAGVVRPSDWDRLESRVCRNTDRLLQIFDDAGVKGTFFVLGWVAERYPELVRRIHCAGHELASHSHEHRLVYELTPEEFRQDLRRAKRAIEDATGISVVGFRAPSFSITEASLWALDVLIEEGYVYDASVYPIHHDRYGIPSWQRGIRRVARGGGGVWEIPGATIRRFGVNLPVGGGGYFRLLPYWWTARSFAILNEKERSPAVFYVHPWEIDPDQPRLNVTLLSRVRHYYNLAGTEARLQRLLTQFELASISSVLSRAASEVERTIASTGHPPTALVATSAGQLRRTQSHSTGI